MSTALPTRAQIDRAGDLNFDRPTDKQANIQISVSPAGLTVVVEYTGAVSSVAAAIERLRAAGVVDLVNASKPALDRAPTTAPAAPQRTKAADPVYQPDGTACCPVHKRELSEGQYGLFCSAKAKPGEVADKKGYCGLKFEV